MAFPDACKEFVLAVVLSEMDKAVAAGASTPVAA